MLPESKLTRAAEQLLREKSRNVLNYETPERKPPISHRIMERFNPYAIDKFGLPTVILLLLIAIAMMTAGFTFQSSFGVLLARLGLVLAIFLFANQRKIW